MTGFFSKLFGGKKKDTNAVPAAGTPLELVRNIMQGLIERSHLELTFDIHSEMNGDVEELTVELTGKDEDMLTEKDGALLDSFQLFIKRAIQHQMPDAKVNVNFDSNNFREESSRSLVELADRLKEKALEQGRSVYLRALPPKDRKIVHQHLANDERVRSRSIGDGLYKKIKIYPVKNADRNENHEEASDTNVEVSETV